MTWSQALLAAEVAAFPNGDKFGALCTAGDGVAADLGRRSSDEYFIVQFGMVLNPDTPHARRVQTSEVSYSTRSDWQSAVTRLGAALECQSLQILFPGSDVIGLRLDERGRVAATSSW